MEPKDLTKDSPNVHVAHVSVEKELLARKYLQIRNRYETKLKELSIIKELMDKLRLTDIDRNTLLTEQLKIIGKYFPLKHICLILLNDALQILEDVASFPEKGWGETPAHRALLFKTANQIMDKKNTIVINDIPDSSPAEPNEGKTITALLGIPLLHNSQTTGVLFIIYPKVFDRNEISFFSLVADQIMTSVILSRLYLQMLQEENKRFLLCRFFSKNVTEEILAQEGILRPGGDRKHATIIFADLRNFTSIAEKLVQEKIVEILNECFSRITPVIFKHEGTLDKLLGDGLMAIFGAPISRHDDALRAVQTAIEIVKTINALNEENHVSKWPELKIGIGLNTGDVVAGYIGSADHLNYTVIGDAVNVAQRIESIAGPNEILITKAVYDELVNFSAEDVPGLKGFKELPAQNVKGKEELIQIFRVEYD